MKPLRLLLVALAPLAACDGAATKRATTAPAPKPAAAASAPDKGTPSATYTVRGKVADVPTRGRPQSDFQLHHEAIDNFADGSGKVVGMNSMTMSFPLGPGMALEGIAPGDIVEITFPVWWGKVGPDYHVTKIVKLRADTKLEFRKASPPKNGG